MFKKSILVVLVLFSLGSAKSNNPETKSGLILSDLIKEALENNPVLKSAYNSWQASEARVPQAGSLPDPEFSFSLMNLPIDNFSLNQEPMSGKQFSIMQMFPFPGKLGLKEKIAGEDAQASKFQYEEMTNQLINDVAIVYYDLFYIDKAIETSQKNSELVKQFTQIAETRYKVGQGLQQDVLKAQVEYLKIMDNLIILQQQREMLEAKLNMLLNRNIDSPVDKPVEPAISQLEKGFSQLQKMAEENKPLLQSWQVLMRQSEQKVKLAKKEFWPDFSLGVSYTQRDALSSGMGGVDFLSGQISVRIPLYYKNKQKKNVQENQLIEKAVKQKYENIRNMVYKELESALTSLEKNKNRLELFKNNIIPKASQAVNSSLAAYQVDKVEFLTLVNNQLTLFNYELEYSKVLSEYQKDFAELEYLVGIKLK